ncbi:MAG: phage terminase large subunit family protein [Leptolyngbyaceae cyanobacterium RM2_2_4]|nr:phage terminase large subunit family protein [Leptolyngbyaceae cyanobacterium RM2_2_4]
MATSDVAKLALSLMQPRQVLSIREYADTYRVIPQGSGSEYGRWRSSKTPYMVEIMETINKPEVRRVVLMCGSQLGKTELLNNICAYYIHWEPSPILFVLPNVGLAKSHSKTRLQPLFDANPALAALVPKDKNSGNEILQKVYPGGSLTLVGSNSATGLSSRPIRILLEDEVDRYAKSAGRDGDPVIVASRRTATFKDHKIIMTSTPTIKGDSRIETEYQLSTMGQFLVPCPHCGEHFAFCFDGLKWDDSQAWYECPYCSGMITDKNKNHIVSKGYWHHRAQSSVIGYHLNEFYSPWSTLKKIVSDYLEVKDNPEMLKAWVNTCLAETYEDESAEILDWQTVRDMAESYPKGFVPSGGLVLTCGVDVQRDRLVYVIRAWGEDEESWLIDYDVIPGNPFTSEPWKALDAVRATKFTHESGKEIQLRLTAIDSADGITQTEVYNYCRTRVATNIIPIKGTGVHGKPIISRPSLKDFDYKGKTYRGAIRLYLVGSHTATSTIYGRLFGAIAQRCTFLTGCLISIT